MEEVHRARYGVGGVVVELQCPFQVPPSQHLDVFTDPEAL